MKGYLGRYLTLLLVAAAVSSIFSSTALAQMRERYVVPDRGQNRAFVVAHDELHVVNKARTARTQALKGLATAEATRKAAEKLATAGETPSLVLYEEGKPRDQYTRRLLTPQIAVELAPGMDAAAVATAEGLINKGPVSPGSRWFIFETTKVGGGLDAAEKLKTRAGVSGAEPQLARLQHKRSIPNDPFFSSQWHLAPTTAVPNVNVNITSVWDNWKGTGIRIGIVDDGLQVNHEDLAPNVDTVNDHDWNDSTPDDPTGNLSTNSNTGDYHGTACAGVAAARGNNGIGVSGAAPEATLVGLRLIAAQETDQDDHDAMLWKSDIIQVKTNSWGPGDDGFTLEGPGTLLKQAFIDATTSGRGGLGTIITWAAGNGGEIGVDDDNSNYDGYANSIYTIAVAAIADDGKRSYYSEQGANVLITTPSNGGSTTGITTVDLTGNTGYNQNGSGNFSNLNYTNDFGGTSSASPLAAGCIALILQSKPTLGWRDVQEILVRSATKCDSTDSDWITNGAGFHFNHKYGAGLLNTQAAVNLAATWTNLGPQLSASSAKPSIGASIPDNSTTGTTQTFSITQSLRVEQVTVTVDITHSNRGQLEVTLTSPTGVVSRLAEVHKATTTNAANLTSLANYSSWTFMSVRDWGESSVGTWTLKVADRTSGRTGTLNSATLTVFGTTGNAAPVISAATITPTGNAFSDETLTVSGVTATDAEGDAITLGYQWQDSTDGSTFTNISGATATTFAVTSESGKKVRCAITPASSGQNGAVFYTSAVAIDHRPGQLAKAFTPYTYDSDLFLAGAGAGGGASGGNFSRAAIINEFSQGSTGTQEWIEILTTQTADLRGWTIGDTAGTYSTFASSTFWSAVPAGTVIVIYNGSTTKDAGLPADDFDYADGKLIIAHTNSTYFTSSTWGGLGNSGDSVLLKNGGGTVVDGVTYGSGTGQTPALGSISAQSEAAFMGGTDAEAEVASNWTIYTTQASVTPGLPNGGSNTTLVTALRTPTSSNSFRFAATSDTVPGLTIDSVTGVVSGSPTAAGFYNVVIERYLNTQSVTLSYSLLVADASGNYVVPSGKIWNLNSNLAITGDLTVVGSLNTSGRALTVGGTLTTTGATVTNATGTITYLHRNGGPLPGAVALTVNAANDVADDDSDGVPNLLELLLGTNPGGYSKPATVVTKNSTGRLQLDVSLPIGPLGVTPAIEVSTDLITWNTGSGFTSTLADSAGGGVRTMSVQSVSTTAPLFIRLRASR
jgi:subtilisin-like proprotein convertase family protein